MTPFIASCSSDIGKSTFQQKLISWSMRRRGTVVRTQKMSRMIVRLLTRVAASCAHHGASQSNMPNGHAQPPRKTTEPNTLKPHMEAYSVNWNIDQRMPEYSTK